MQFWMHDEDRKLIRELSAWLAGQGTRPSDSMVIRAALVARTGTVCWRHTGRPLSWTAVSSRVILMIIYSLMRL